MSANNCFNIKYFDKVCSSLFNAYSTSKQKQKQAQIRQMKNKKITTVLLYTYKLYNIKFPFGMSNFPARFLEAHWAG